MRYLVGCGIFTRVKGADVCFTHPPKFASAVLGASRSGEVALGYPEKIVETSTNEVTDLF